MPEPMSEPTADRDEAPDDGEDLGSLTVEDDPEGTVDPGELAGGADDSDADELHPTFSEEDLED
ncbi:MAG TPA: hypothetical protein VIT42_09285 [Microlunatus sp.]